jgi:hypothetical protein
MIIHRCNVTRITMYKNILPLVTFSMMAVAGFSQTTPRVEKALNDPKRAENSAKADVYVQSKPIIKDSTQQATRVSTRAVSKKKRISKRRSHQ